MIDRLLTVKQVAAYLGMHEKTLYRLLRSNKIALRYIRIHGRTIMLRDRDVENFLTQREVDLDGAGRERKPRKTQPKAHVMTDHEAQEFFDGIPKTKDGHLAGSDSD